MPELPEVETIRRDLEKVLVNKKITSVAVKDNKIVGGKPAVFVSGLNGQKIIGIERRGKLLAFKLNSGKYLLAHMKMTGQLIYLSGATLPPSSREAGRPPLKKRGTSASPMSPSKFVKKMGKGASSMSPSNLEGVGGVIAGGHQVGRNDLQVPNKFTRVVIEVGRDLAPTLPLKGEGARVSPPARGGWGAGFPPLPEGRVRVGWEEGVGAGGILYFNDLRRFGYLKIVSKEEKEKIFKNSFGIEPLTPDFKFKNFIKIFQNRQTNLKAILMNQKLISGLGNIYVDEACFCAGLLPWRKAKSLKEKELKKLFDCIKKVLAVAVKNRGTTFKDFRGADGKHGGHYNFLNVYERTGLPCKRCDKGLTPTLRSGLTTGRARKPSLAHLVVVKKTKHAGRGTHYCVKCQK